MDKNKKAGAEFAPASLLLRVQEELALLGLLGRLLHRLLRGLLGSLLLRSHESISWSGVDHRSDPPVDRSAATGRIRIRLVLRA